MVWEFPTTACPRFEIFGDGCMVFDPLSWETHHASDHVALILDVIRGAPASTQAIAEALCGEAPTSEEMEALERILHEMADIGLIRESRDR